MNIIKKIFRSGSKGENGADSTYKDILDFWTRGTLYIPHKGRIQRICIMNSCEIFMEHRLEGGPFSVTMANVEYDPGQGLATEGESQLEEREIHLVIDGALQIFSYRTYDEEDMRVNGLGLKSIHNLYLFEFDPDVDEATIQQLELILGQLLHEHMKEVGRTLPSRREAMQYITPIQYEDLLDSPSPNASPVQPDEEESPPQDNNYYPHLEEYSYKPGISGAGEERKEESKGEGLTRGNTQEEDRAKYFKHKSTIPLIKGCIITSVQGSLYKYNKVISINEILEEECILHLVPVPAGNFEYALIFATPMNMFFTYYLTEYEHIYFPYGEQFTVLMDKEGTAFLFYMTKTSDKQILANCLARCKIEHERKGKFEKLVSKENEPWVEAAYCSPHLPPGTDLEFENEDDGEWGEVDMQDVNLDDNKETLHVATKGKTLLIQGNSVLVYDHQPDDSLNYQTSLPLVSTQDRKPINPEKSILHDGENAMLMIDELSNNIYKMDLNRGQIVETFQTDGISQMKSISQTFKNAQYTGNKEFLGIHKRGIFHFDTRLASQQKVVDKVLYKGNPNFRCMETTMEGGLAIGSNNGEIRLYKSYQQKMAKTLFPGFGDRITGIDCTHDGHYILATCDKYLILIPATITTPKGILATGFTERMGKNKPIPFKLLLKMQDIIEFRLQQAIFSPAHFNNGEKMGCESAIVSSIAEYTVVWNFEKARRGFVDDYTIRKMGYNIVQNQFKFNTDDNLIVTTVGGVSIQKRII